MMSSERSWRCTQAVARYGSRALANGGHAVQVRALVLDRLQHCCLHVSQFGIAPSPYMVYMGHVWRVRFARFGLDASVWPGRSTWGN